MMEILETITGLSHEFGTADYVQAGGGNTSCKDEAFLWVKPSGTTLAGMTAAAFVKMDRAKLRELYLVPTPTEAKAREALVSQMMAAAVEYGTSARASVEAPLHESLSARFVVHTHPAWMNGLTCAMAGKEAAGRLFPEALWIPYTDPGYTLCMVARKMIQEYKAAHGREPTVLILENHGVFVCGETAEEVRERMAVLRGTLENVYSVAQAPSPVAKNIVNTAEGGCATLVRILAEALGAEGACCVSVPRFETANGALTPDHIVYAKSYLFDGAVTVENLRAFVRVRGYAPRVVVTPECVIGVGATEKVARLALTLAQDAGQIQTLARAFGGVKFLDDRSRSFIENWEAESYRQKQG